MVLSPHSQAMGRPATLTGRAMPTHCNALQHTATHCNTLQHTATHCNALQHTATHGAGDAVRFNKPYGIAVDADGTIYVADCGNNCVRQMSPDDGAVSTLAGDGKEGAGFADGLGSTARFFTPGGLALDTDSTTSLSQTWATTASAE